VGRETGGRAVGAVTEAPPAQAQATVTRPDESIKDTNRNLNDQAAARAGAINDNRRVEGSGVPQHMDVEARLGITYLRSED